MPLSDIVVISIVNSTGGVTQAGFGEACLLTCEASWSERLRRYTNAAAVLVDFPTATGPTYLAAAAYFGQNPCPTSLAIGRRALKPTQKWQISLAAVTAGDSYEMRVGADDITVTAGSGTFAANDTIVVQLNAAIQAADGYAASGFTSSVTGTGGSKYIELTASTAGNWIAVETYDRAKILIEQTHADAGIATDLAAIAAEDNTWYGLLTTFNSKAEVTAAATWVEANKKLYPVQSSDSIVATVALASDVTTGGTNLPSIAKAMKTAARDRTAVFYNAAPDSFLDAGLCGVCFPMDPGSETWAFKTVSGANADSLTPTEQANISAKYANYYYTVAGRNITNGGEGEGGMLASGHFIDSTRFIDWLTARLQERIFLALANAKKIPFTDSGIATIEAIVRATLEDGVRAGGLAPNSYVVIFPKAADISDADKAARKLTGTFTAEGAGAIHGVTVSGTITV